MSAKRFSLAAATVLLAAGLFRSAPVTVLGGTPPRNETDRERNAMGLVIYPVDRPYHDKAMATVRNALGEQAFATAWTEAQALSLDEAIEQALEAESVCLSRG